MDTVEVGGIRILPRLPDEGDMKYSPILNK